MAFQPILFHVVIDFRFKGEELLLLTAVCSIVWKFDDVIVVNHWHYLLQRALTQFVI